MNELNFNEEDKAKFIEFLNAVARHADFKMNTIELVNYFKLLSYMQQKILAKIDANILAVKQVVEPEEKPKKEARTKGKE